jgi:hypothetical protein
MTHAGVSARTTRDRRRSSSPSSLSLPLLPLLLLLPAASALARSPARGPEPKDAEQKRALQGLDDNDSDTGSDADNGVPAQEMRGPGADDMTPERHVVQKGDSLWTICEHYFHDPWRWPKIWALNPEVTNPHWIFPGQVVRIGGMTTSVAGAPAPDEPASRPLSAAPPRMTAAKSLALGNGALREVGFVDAQELAFAGTINGSREEKNLLASGDQAYVQFTSDRLPKFSQRFTIYQVDQDHPVKDIHSGVVFGYLVRIYGDITIEMPPSSTHPVAAGTLRDLVQPVERGYRVGPVFHQFKTIKPRANAVGTTAQVVGAVQPNILIAEGMFVVLNRGRRHGLEPGNRLRIVRQGDGYRRIMDPGDMNDDRFPPDAVAEVMAVDVRDESSIAWVTGGNRSIRIGDVADMKKGY